MTLRLGEAVSQLRQDPPGRIRPPGKEFTVQPAGTPQFPHETPDSPPIQTPGPKTQPTPEPPPAPQPQTRP